jgi:hypothetical protein
VNLKTSKLLFPKLKNGKAYIEGYFTLPFILFRNSIILRNEINGSRLYLQDKK